MKNKLTPLLIACLMLFSYSHAQTTPHQTQKPKKKEGKTVSIIKFIPGLQQLKQKKYFKGSLLLGSFLAASTGAILFNKKGNDWYKKYQNSTSVQNIVQYRDQAEKNFRNRNFSIIGIFSVWFVHILDLKFFKPKKESSKKTARITANVGTKHAQINLCYVF